MPESNQQDQPKIRIKYELTEEDFNRLLKLLDPDREIAGEKYLQLRKRLLLIFGRRQDPEALVDEAINRYCKKLNKIENGEFSTNEKKLIEEELTEVEKTKKEAEIISAIHNVVQYCIRIAVNLKKESFRNLPKHNALDPNHPENRPGAEAILINKFNNDCYLLCLQKLAVDEREKMFQYFEGRGAERIKIRTILAGINDNDTEEERRLKSQNLRQDISRSKRGLKKCAEECLKGKR